MHVPNISGIKCTVFLPNSEDSRLKQTQESRVYNSEFFFSHVCEHGEGAYG